MNDTPGEGEDKASFRFDEEALLHALVSHYEREQDRRLIFEQERPPSLFDDFDEDPLLDPFVRSRRYAPLFDRLDQGHRNLWDLLRLKGSARARAIRQAPYRDPLVARLLLEKSAKAQPNDPRWSKELAELAASIADELDPEQAEDAAALQAAARCLQANLRRLDQDWDGAEERLRAASSALAGWERSVEHAHLYYQLGRLREDQGRLEEAIELLWGAAIEYHAQRDRYSGNQCLVQIAFLYLRQGDPGRAMNLLTFLSVWIGGGRLGAVVDLGRAACLAALNLPKPARRLLQQSLRGRRQIRRHDHRIPLEWLECRISLHLGDLDRAVPRLEAIRRWFLFEGSPENVCLSSIDLALGYARQGRLAEQLPELLVDLASQADGKRWLVKALQGFGKAVLERKADPGAAARQAARRVFEPPKTWSRRTGPSNRRTEDLSSEAAGSVSKEALLGLRVTRRGRVLAHEIEFEEEGREDLLLRLLREAKDPGVDTAEVGPNPPAEALEEDRAAEPRDDLRPRVIGRKPRPPG